MVTLLLLALLLTGCGKKDESRDSVSIWYMEADCPAALEKWAEEYNSQRAEGMLPVSLRAFSDEESLAAAFDAQRPDMLLCSYIKAADLSSRGLLRDIGAELESKPAYTSRLCGRLDTAGRSYFPIGFETQLLIYEPESFTAADLREPESFCRRLTELSDRGSPVFAAESYTEILYLWLLSAGRELQCELKADLREEEFINVYNLFAELAYDGALLCDELPRTAFVSSGLIPAAAISSRQLAGADTEGLSLSCLPVYRDCREYPADCLGFAVTLREGRSARHCGAFLSWLSENDGWAGLALESGLVPGVESAAVPQDNASELLLEMSREMREHLPYADSGYMENRNSFEADIRAAARELMLNYS